MGKTIILSSLSRSTPSKLPPRLITKAMPLLTPLLYRPRDELNASIEGNFTVTLLDQAEIAYDPNTLDGTLYTISNSGVTDVFVQGPVGQDLNISSSPTIPSGLNVTFHSDQGFIYFKTILLRG